MPRTTHGVGGIGALLAVLAAGADAAAPVDPIFADGFESAPLLHFVRWRRGQHGHARRLRHDGRRHQLRRRQIWPVPVVRVRRLRLCQRYACSGRILGESHRRLLVLHVRAAFDAVHLGPRQPLHGSLRRNRNRRSQLVGHPVRVDGDDPVRPGGSCGHLLPTIPRHMAPLDHSLRRQRHRRKERADPYQSTSTTCWWSRK